jgi:hypothetical protein
MPSVISDCGFGMLMTGRIAEVNPNPGPSQEPAYSAFILEHPGNCQSAQLEE